MEKYIKSDKKASQATINYKVLMLRRKERGLKLTSLVSHTSAPSVYITSSFWLPFPGAKRIFFTHPRCVGIPLMQKNKRKTILHVPAQCIFQERMQFIRNQKWKQAE